jgi:hypothetical protein
LSHFEKGGLKGGFSIPPFQIKIYWALGINAEFGEGMACPEQSRRGEVCPTIL